ncbi:MAG TPA: RluA family pseudouridine synthase, partial [Candidatus Thalassarchaeaceae archaeon]
MSRIDVQVEADSDLLSVLQSVHDNATSNRLRRMIDDGRVHIDEKVCRVARTPVIVGQKVSILPRAQGDAPKRQSRSSLELPKILYEDDRLLVADKPAGLLSVTTSKGKEKDTMHARAFEYAAIEGGRVFIVHRLDRETSGCMLFAKDERTKRY